MGSRAALLVVIGGLMFSGCGSAASTTTETPAASPATTKEAPLPPQEEKVLHEVEREHPQLPFPAAKKRAFLQECESGGETSSTVCHCELSRTELHSTYKEGEAISEPRKDIEACKRGE